MCDRPVCRKVQFVDTHFHIVVHFRCAIARGSVHPLVRPAIRMFARPCTGSKCMCRAEGRNPSQCWCWCRVGSEPTPHGVPLFGSADSCIHVADGAPLPKMWTSKIDVNHAAIISFSLQTGFQFENRGNPSPLKGEAAKRPCACVQRHDRQAQQNAVHLSRGVEALKCFRMQFGLEFFVQRR